MNDYGEPSYTKTYYTGIWTDKITKIIDAEGQEKLTQATIHLNTTIDINSKCKRGKDTTSSTPGTDYFKVLQIRESGDENGVQFYKIYLG